MLPGPTPDLEMNPFTGADPISVGSPTLEDFPSAAGLPGVPGGAIDLLNSYAHIFVAAFLVTLLATPLVRRFAIKAGVIDHPDLARKLHAFPVAYMGGVAVFLGLIVAIAVSYISPDPNVAQYGQIPIAIIVGMVAITFTGLADDVWGWDPRLKIMGQLVAAAALAIEDVGVRVAEGVLAPVLGPAADPLFTIDFIQFTLLNGHVYYWVGTALIAIFVLGGCNSANLIDGLDGLLTGVVAIVAVGLLAICLIMLPGAGGAGPGAAGAVSGLAGARVILCVALLGATLGFLPHNFNPAAIFLGDCGSLLLGYMCAVIILMLGDLGQTHLVFAGLIVFALPIIDTTLAMIRRRLAGTSMSAGDHQHLHHQLKRTLGGVKRAVAAMYAISILFALLGVSLAALVIYTNLRVRVIYAIALVLFSSIGVVAVKAARRQQILKSVNAVAGGSASTKPAAAATKEASTTAASTAGSSTP